MNIGWLGTGIMGAPMARNVAQAGNEVRAWNGTRAKAEAGELNVLAAAAADLRDRVQPILDAVGRRTTWFDEIGDATRLKLVANSWVVALTAGVGETLAVAKALGVPGERFLELIAGGPIDSGYDQLKGKAMLAGDFEPSFSLAL